MYRSDVVYLLYENMHFYYFLVILWYIMDVPDISGDLPTTTVFIGSNNRYCNCNNVNQLHIKIINNYCNIARKPITTLMC